MTNFVEQEILEQPSILRMISEKTHVLLESYSFLQEPSNVVITGCGDSYCAALAGEYFFERNGIQATAVHAMDLSRHRRDMLEGCILITISVSGRTRRVLECTKIASKYGAPVISLTDDLSSELASEGYPIPIHASLPEKLKESSYESELASKYIGYQHDVPQTKTYLANLASLYILAAALGGSSSIASARNELIDSSSILEKNYVNTKEQISKIVSEHCSVPYFFCGSGINLSTARYASYKLYEYCLPTHLGIEIEEYCHTQYFATTKDDSVVFLAQNIGDFQRIKEIVIPLKEDLGINPILISQITEEIPGIKKISLPYSDSFLANFLGITVSIQQLTLALALANHRNVNTFRGGIDTEEYVSTSYKTIRKSIIWEKNLIP